MNTNMHWDIKRLIGVLFVVVIFREFRCGYFRDVKSYTQSLLLARYLKWFLFLAVLVVATFFWDSKIQARVSGWDHPFAEGIGSLGRHLGKNIWVYLGGFYLVGWISRKEGWCRLAFGMLLGTALTGLVSVVLKMIFLRSRPDMQFGPYSFFHPRGLFQDDNSFQSFPSGDVAIIAGAMSYLSYSIPNRYLSSIPLLLPLSTAFSRITLNDHWLSDTLCSFGLSLILSHIVWNYKRTSLTSSFSGWT